MNDLYERLALVSDELDSVKADAARGHSGPPMRDALLGIASDLRHVAGRCDPHPAVELSQDGPLLPRQPAYDAVWNLFQTHRAEGFVMPADHNGRVWEAVEAALDAMQIPTSESRSAQ